MTTHLAPLLFILLAQPAPPSSARPPAGEPTPPTVGPKEKAKAKALLDQASRLYDRHEYAQALEKFTAAYDIYPSPNLLYNIGQTYQDLAKPVEALETFERFLAATENDSSRGVQQQRSEVRSLMESAKSMVGRLQVECLIAGAEIRIDGKRVGVAPLPAPVWVAPGSHQITATFSEGYFPGLENVLVSPGQLTSARVELKPIPPPAPPPAPVLAKPTPAEVAAEHDRKGKLFYEAGNYLGAIAEFEAEYVINADPAVLFNIGQAYRLAQKPEQAIRAYQRYLERRPQAENRQYVQTLIANLEESLRPKSNARPPAATVAPGPPGATPAGQAPPQPYYPPAPGMYAQPSPGYPASPYGAGPPLAYAPPYYPPLDLRPAVLDYDPDKPIPKGYTLESNSRRGFVVSGSIIFSISYLISIAVAGSTTESGSSSSSSSTTEVPFDSSLLYIPVLGPWLALGSVKDQTCSSSDYSCSDSSSTTSAWKTLLVLGGVTQTLGAGFVLLGLTVRSRQLVLTDNVRASVIPVPMGHSGQGLAMVGSFSGL